MIDYSQLPADLHGTVQRYIEHRIPMGSFMDAVVRNDLKGAFGNADHINRHRIFEIVSWFYNEAPAQCWGSNTNVDLWLKGEE